MPELNLSAANLLQASPAPAKGPLDSTASKSMDNGTERPQEFANVLKEQQSQAQTEPERTSQPSQPAQTQGNNKSQTEAQAGEGKTAKDKTAATGKDTDKSSETDKAAAAAASGLLALTMPNNLKADALQESASDQAADTAPSGKSDGKNAVLDMSALATAQAGEAQTAAIVPKDAAQTTAAKSAAPTADILPARDAKPAELADKNESTLLDKRQDQASKNLMLQSDADKAPVVPTEDTAKPVSAALSATAENRKPDTALVSLQHNAGPLAQDGVGAKHPDTSQISQFLNAQPTHTSAANTPTVTVATPVGAQNWSQEVGQHMVWMAKGDEGRAELQLTPPQLGRVEISLNIKGDQATATFIAANPNAREALEQAIPKLREILDQAGIQLGHTSVNSGHQQQNSQNQDASARAHLMRHFGGEENMENVRSSPGLTGLMQGRGMVDIYA